MQFQLTILIKNAEQIGVVPENIAKNITYINNNEILDSDISLHSKIKKKKRRSASLTRKPYQDIINSIVRKVGKNEKNFQMEIDLIGNIEKLKSPLLKRKQEEMINENKNTKMKQNEAKLNKKSRYSLDKLVLKGKNKINKDGTDKHKINNSSSLERRSTTSECLINPRTENKTLSMSYNSLQFDSEEKIQNNIDMIMDAVEDLSDDNNDCYKINQSNNLNEMNTSFNQNYLNLSNCNMHKNEFVCINKKDFDYVLNRLSQIEAIIKKQELDNNIHSLNEMPLDSANKVQIVYEKTLENANALAYNDIPKNISKTFKKRSEECMSPSQRKIKRRQSQEKKDFEIKQKAILFCSDKINSPSEYRTKLHSAECKSFNSLRMPFENKTISTLKHTNQTWCNNFNDSTKQDTENWVQGEQILGKTSDMSSFYFPRRESIVHLAKAGKVRAAVNMIDKRVGRTFSSSNSIIDHDQKIIESAKQSPKILISQKENEKTPTASNNIRPHIKKPLTPFNPRQMRPPYAPENREKKKKPIKATEIFK